MTTEQTFSLLIERAQAEQDSAARQLGQANAKLAQQQQKLATLEGFRAEYAARQAEQLRQGLGVAELLNFRRFIAQLDQGIELQQQALRAADREFAQARLRWQEAHRRLKSLEILVERRATVALRRSQRREQGESDAFAQRRAEGALTGALPRGSPK